MAMTCLAAVIVGTSLATALVGGVVQLGAPGAEMVSIALALTTGVAVVSAVSLDG